MNGIPTDHLAYSPWSFTPATREHQPVDNTGTPGDGPPERMGKSARDGCRGRRSKRIHNLTTGEVYADANEAVEKLQCSRSGVIGACCGELASIKGVRLEYVR